MFKLMRKKRREAGFGVLEAGAARPGFATKRRNYIKLASACQSQVSGMTNKYYVFVCWRMDSHLRPRTRRLERHGAMTGGIWCDGEVT
jgi:hypothetical protein